MPYCGKKLCINDEGIISVIDFDIAVINNNHLSKKIKKRADSYSYDILKTRILKILNEKL
jgi:hypothetical protein